MSILTWCRRWFRWPNTEAPSLIQEAIWRFQHPLAVDEAVYASRTRIVSLYPSIEQYTQAIKKCHHCLMDDRPYLNRDHLQETSIPLSVWFLKSEGYHGNPSELLSQFCQQVVTFLSDYERRQHEVDQQACLINNLYRATPIVNNLIALSQQLGRS